MIDQSDTALRGVQALYDNNLQTTQADLDRFARSFNPAPGLGGFAYQPEINAGEREAFEADLRGSHFSSLGIWPAPDAEGRKPAGDSELYFPMAASFYFDGRPAVLGFDSYSQTGHRTAIDAVIETGRATSTGIIGMGPSRRSSTAGFVLYRPVYEKLSFEGVVSAWIELPSLLQAAQSPWPIVEKATLEIGDFDRRLLFVADDTSFARVVDRDPFRAVFEQSRYGRIWRVIVASQPLGTDWLLGYGLAAVILASGLAAAAGVYAYASAARRKQELLFAESLRRRALDDLVPLVWLTKPGGEIVEVNKSAMAAEGSKNGATIGSQFAGLPLWDDAVENRKALANAMQTAARGEEVQLDATGRTSENHYATYHVSMRPIRNDNGHVAHLAISALDVSERAEAEETERLLMREIDHRMKNTLQVLQGIVRRTAHGHRTVESFEKALMGRIMTMSRAHELLADERWQSANLRKIVMQELDTFETAGAIPSVSGAPIRVNSRAALAFALAIHELGTNATKYGALSVPSGRISIAWTFEGEPADRNLEFIWRESGGPKVAAPKQSGFGTLLLQRIIAYDLDGETELDFARHGLVCRILIPWKKIRPTIGQETAVAASA